eukprot:TRINITY_DN9570_c0_g1_i1.p1 TRINITY_DN9570_c0_g1~~TRINITY_DN9570_c0_g1_i1.p1  ORF type:complete len:179 (-),score=20.08 TRINITY_DN9570_c0_g1_i1:55-591(-)
MLKPPTEPFGQKPAITLDVHRWRGVAKRKSGESLKTVTWSYKPSRKLIVRRWEEILSFKNELQIKTDGGLFIPGTLTAPYVDFIVIDSTTETELKEKTQPRILLVTVSKSIVDYHLTLEVPKCQLIFEERTTKSKWLQDLLNCLDLTEKDVEFLYLTAYIEGNEDFTKEGLILSLIHI